MTRRAADLRVPVSLRHDVAQIFKLTDPFCAGHLDAEYGELVRTLVAKLARKRPSPLARDVLRIGQLDPEFCRRDLRASNPMAWRISINGVCGPGRDARRGDPRRVAGGRGAEEGRIEEPSP
jgi:hypothetical protein